MRIEAYAKINLYLDVMGRRPDGFHNIRSIMHRVSLCDYITVTQISGDNGDIIVNCGDAPLPKGEGNLVWKAAKIFFEYTKIEEYSVAIDIEKHIPISAGLAGGSADAAATLVALNEIFKTNLTHSELCGLGAVIGSDVPFCISGRTSLAEGRGEIITDIDSKLEMLFVIAKGGEGVSTPRAYGKIDEKFGDSLSEEFGDLQGMLSAVKSGDVNGICKHLYNTFEEVVLRDHAEASMAKTVMLENGAAVAMLSGSGPSVFGIFTDEKDAESVCQKLSLLGYESHVCRSL